MVFGIFHYLINGIAWYCIVLYRVSLKKGNFSDFRLISVLEVEFYFFTCDLESEFGAPFI